MIACWFKGHLKKWEVNGRCINQVCQRHGCWKVFQVFPGGREEAAWLNGITSSSNDMIPPDTTAWREP